MTAQVMVDEAFQALVPEVYALFDAAGCAFAIPGINC